MKDSIILLVKECIATHACVQTENGHVVGLFLDDIAVDHIAEDISEKLYSADYRKYSDTVKDKEKYNLDFSINTDHKVSISKAGIAFGAGVIRTLGYPEKVNIGIDKANGIIGVKVAREPDKFIKAYPFCTSKQKRTWLRIVSKSILKSVEEITGITYGNTATNYHAYYDKDKKIIIVNLKQKEDK